MSFHTALYVLAAVWGVYDFARRFKASVAADRAWLFANDMRSLRERADAMEPKPMEPCESFGYRSAPQPATEAPRPRFIARLRGRIRARQELAMERRLSR